MKMANVSQLTQQRRNMPNAHRARRSNEGGRHERVRPSSQRSETMTPNPASNNSQNRISPKFIGRLQPNAAYR